jgi:hypothetical protein
MAATQAARVRDTSTSPQLEKHEWVEEIYYRKGDIDFCFLLNRRHHNLRVFDYRVGNYQQKRDFFDRIARAEGLRKVFTVVEKQDSKSWRSVGFSREGAIPGYFRTADAYIMSRVYTEDGDPIQGGAPKLQGPNVPSKEKQPAKPRGLSVEIVSDQARLESITQGLPEGAVYAPFRRGTFHPDVGLHAKIGRREYWVGAETDSSFGHAKVDLMIAPEKEADIANLEYCMSAMLEELVKMDTASVFGLCPVDDAMSNQVYAELGFKVSARLTDHVTRGEDFVGCQLWHRRLANQSAPRLPSFI